MRIDFVTLFPEMVQNAMSVSMMGRARSSGAVEVSTVDPRSFAVDKHRSVDDAPSGGGPGMVMMAPPIHEALKSIGACPDTRGETRVALLDPAGTPFRQRHARELAGCPRLVLVCGHYEGVDERVRTRLCTDAFSVADCVVTGGELPALMIADAVVRLLPGVLGDPESHEDDSFEDGLLGHPLYTRPNEFLGEKVPDVLLSGDHGRVKQWRRSQALKRTRESRPDLFAASILDRQDVSLLE